MATDTKYIKSKFRGKTVKGDFIYPVNKWVEGDLLHHIMGEDGLVYTTSIKSAIMYHVYPETVGQFIGFKDKMGKELFTGDIVKHAGWYCKIVYGINGACYSLISLKDGQTDLSVITESACQYMEHVGTIYDNTELLYFDN